MNIKNKILSVFGALLLIPGHFALADTFLSNPYAPMGSQSNPVNVQSSGGSGIPLLSNPYAPVGSQSNPIYIQETRSLNSTQSGSLNPSGYRCAYDYSVYITARDKAYQEISELISSMEGFGVDKGWMNMLYTDKGRVSHNYYSYMSDCYRIDKVLKIYNGTQTGISADVLEQVNSMFNQPINAGESKQTVPVKTTSSVSGCTSTVGFSPTTGQSCSGSVTSANSNKTELCPYLEKSVRFFPSPPPMNDPAWVAPPACICSVGYEADKSGQACIKKTDTSPTSTGESASSMGGRSTDSFLTTLSNGASGWEVKSLQAVLIKFGHMQGDATGYFGAKTKAALSAYQTQNGLEAVGVTGPKTRALLNQTMREIIN